MGRNRNKGVNCSHVPGVAYQDKYSLSSLASLHTQGFVKCPEYLQDQVPDLAACKSFAKSLMPSHLNLLKSRFF